MKMSLEQWKSRGFRFGLASCRSNRFPSVQRRGAAAVKTVFCECACTQITLESFALGPGKSTQLLLKRAREIDSNFWRTVSKANWEQSGSISERASLKVSRGSRLEKAASWTTTPVQESQHPTWKTGRIFWGERIRPASASDGLCEIWRAIRTIGRKASLTRGWSR